MNSGNEKYYYIKNEKVYTCFCYKQVLYIVINYGIKTQSTVNQMIVDFTVLSFHNYSILFSIVTILLSIVIFQN